MTIIEKEKKEEEGFHQIKQTKWMLTFKTRKDKN